MLADIYLEKRDRNRAERILLLADSLIDRGVLFNLEKLKVYSRLSGLYLDFRDYKRASQYQSKYISLRDSVYNEELTTGLMKEEAKFLERDNEAKLYAQAQLLALNEKVITRQYWLNGLVSLTTLLFIALSVVLYKTHNRSRKVNKLLDQKIKERTRDLEASHNSLLALINQERHLVEKLNKEVTIKMAMIRTLCSMARREFGDRTAHSYIDAIEKIASEVHSEMWGVKLNETNLRGSSKFAD